LFGGFEDETNSIKDNRIAYDIAKASRLDHLTWKTYTDMDFVRDYQGGNFTIVSKVLSSSAVSQRAMVSIIQFIADSKPKIDTGLTTIHSLVDSITVTQK